MSTKGTLWKICSTFTTASRIHATKNCIHGSRSGTSQFVSGSWSHGHLPEDSTTVASSTKCGKFHTDLQSRAEEKGVTQENFKKHVSNMGKYIGNGLKEDSIIPFHSPSRCTADDAIVQSLLCVLIEHVAHCCFLLRHCRVLKEIFQRNARGRRSSFAQGGWPSTFKL